MCIESDVGIKNDGSLSSRMPDAVLVFDRIDSFIRIRILSPESVIGEIVVSVVLFTTFTASIDAVNNLLLREVQKLTSLDGPGALNCANGSERPARVATTLVTDLIHDTFLSPVDT